MLDAIYALLTQSDQERSKWLVCGTAEPNAAHLREENRDVRFKRSVINMFLQLAVKRFDLYLVSVANLEPFNTLADAAQCSGTQTQCAIVPSQLRMRPRFRRATAASELRRSPRRAAATRRPQAELSHACPRDCTHHLA